jgi:hypothetical protein
MKDAELSTRPYGAIMNIHVETHFIEKKETLVPYVLKAAD